jgi:hypothetical protein
VNENIEHDAEWVVVGGVYPSVVLLILLRKVMFDVKLPELERRVNVLVAKLNGRSEAVTSFGSECSTFPASIMAFAEIRLEEDRRVSVDAMVVVVEDAW